jgi:hypothetical protein
VLQVVQPVQDVQAVQIGRMLKSAVFEVQDSNSGDENDCAEKNRSNILSDRGTDKHACRRASPDVGTAWR